MSLNIIEFLRFFLVIVLSIDIHEFSHALSATWLGDDLPRYQGRLTVNPIAHLDPLGTIMIVMSSLTGFGIGWGKPVQVNPRRLRYGPAVGMGLVAIAGPISNIVLAIVAAIGYHLVPAGAAMFGLFALINVTLAFFNLIPLYPLDGFSVALAILRLIRGRTALQVAYWLESTATYGAMIFLALIVFGQFLPFNIFGILVGTPAGWLLRVLGVA